MKDKRDHLSIYSDVLSRSIKGTNKTEIMGRVGLTSCQMHMYTNLLTRYGLLEVQVTENAAIYRTTSKGRKFLKAFGTLLELLK